MVYERSPNGSRFEVKEEVDDKTRIWESCFGVLSATYGDCIAFSAPYEAPSVVWRSEREFSGVHDRFVLRVHAYVTESTAGRKGPEVHLSFRSYIGFLNVRPTRDFSVCDGLLRPPSILQRHPFRLIRLYNWSDFYGEIAFPSLPYCQSLPEYGGFCAQAVICMLTSAVRWAVPMGPFEASVVAAKQQIGRAENCLGKAENFLFWLAESRGVDRSEARRVFDDLIPSAYSSSDVALFLGKLERELRSTPLTPEERVSVYFDWHRIYSACKTRINEQGHFEIDREQTTIVSGLDREIMALVLSSSETSAYGLREDIGLPEDVSSGPIPEEYVNVFCQIVNSYISHGIPLAYLIDEEKLPGPARIFSDAHKEDHTDEKVGSKYTGKGGHAVAIVGATMDVGAEATLVYMDSLKGPYRTLRARDLVEARLRRGKETEVLIPESDSINLIACVPWDFPAIGYAEIAADLRRRYADQDKPVPTISLRHMEQERELAGSFPDMISRACGLFWKLYDHISGKTGIYAPDEGPILL